MQRLNEDRLKQILHCLLSEIADYAEMDKETYISWLRTEVGISQNELEELNSEGLLPMPVEPYIPEENENTEREE